MSDPVTQAEIEDVLSSIRRLVSEDGRSLSRPVPSVQEVPKPASRLVLTPALRVSAAPAEADASPVPATSVAEGLAAGYTATDQSDREAEKDQALDLGGRDMQAPVGTQDPVGKDERYPRAQAASEIAHEVELEFNQGTVFAFSRDEAGQNESGEHESGEDTASVASDSGDVRAVEGAISQDPGPETHRAASEPSGDPAPWRQPGATLYEAAVPADQDNLAEGETAAAIGVEGGTDQSGLEETRIDKMAAETSFEPDASFEADPTSSQRVSAVVQKMAELEAKVARSQEQWEPDGDSSDPYAGTNIETLEWQDHIDDATESAQSAGVDTGEEDSVSEAEAAQMDSGFAAEIADAAQLAQDAVAEETLGALEGLTGDESYLDEDSLRELVADIVRSELQGALGERITRNVRKLVRREIQRALAAQDLI